MESARKALRKGTGCRETESRQFPEMLRRQRAEVEPHVTVVPKGGVGVGEDQE